VGNLVGDDSHHCPTSDLKVGETQKDPAVSVDFNFTAGPTSADSFSSYGTESEKKGRSEKSDDRPRHSVLLRCHHRSRQAIAGEVFEEEMLF
jgi:hypothetical protein